MSKIIYLDIDTIIQKDLSNLYDLSSTTTFMGGIETIVIPYIQTQNYAYLTKQDRLIKKSIDI
ncbi:MAG: hypothetical protein LBF36_00100 [Mycoplasmataceae bacterium]|nr:hypothetical protein [Mycoplasmataceae bacterium]